jgi:hypothetical protein
LIVFLSSFAGSTVGDASDSCASAGTAALPAALVSGSAAFSLQPDKSKLQPSIITVIMYFYSISFPLIFSLILFLYF